MSELEWPLGKQSKNKKSLHNLIQSKITEKDVIYLIKIIENFISANLKMIKKILYALLSVKVFAHIHLVDCNQLTGLNLWIKVKFSEQNPKWQIIFQI